jgi:hypothetical protein
MRSKSFWKSKTIWVNGLIAVSGLIQLLTGNTWLDASIQAEIIVVVNVILRIFTNSGLKK